MYEADWKQFDINGDGSIEGDECKALARFQMGDENATDEAVNNLVAAIDRNADGKIGRNEYLTAILGPEWSVISRKEEQSSAKFLMEQVWLGERWETDVKEEGAEGSPGFVSFHVENQKLVVNAGWSEDMMFLDGKWQVRDPATEPCLVFNSTCQFALRELYAGPGRTMSVDTGKVCDPRTGEMVQMAHFELKFASEATEKPSVKELTFNRVYHCQ